MGALIKRNCLKRKLKISVIFKITRFDSCEASKLE